MKVTSCKAWMHAPTVPDLPDSPAVIVATGAWKHTISGDWNRGTVAENEALAAGTGGARIGR